MSTMRLSMIGLLGWNARIGNILTDRGSVRLCEDCFERVEHMPSFNAGGIEDRPADAQPLGLADELFQIDVHDDTGAG